MAACRYRKRLLKSCTFCIYTPSIYMEIIRDNSYRCIYICNKVSGKLQIFQCVYRHILLHNTPAVKPFTLQITCHCIRFCYFFIFSCPPETITCTSGCSSDTLTRSPVFVSSESVIFRPLTCAPSTMIHLVADPVFVSSSKCSFLFPKGFLCIPFMIFISALRRKHTEIPIIVSTIHGIPYKRISAPCNSHYSGRQPESESRVPFFSAIQTAL